VAAFSEVVSVFCRPFFFPPAGCGPPGPPLFLRRPDDELTNFPNLKDCCRPDRKGSAFDSSRGGLPGLFRRNLKKTPRRSIPVRLVLKVDAFDF